MERHLADPISVEELARAVGLSPSYLTQLFRRATGRSPARYWRDMRLERARTLLQVPSLSVTDVMKAVGWTEESQFRRDFPNAPVLSAPVQPNPDVQQQSEKTASVAEAIEPP